MFSASNIHQLQAIYNSYGQKETAAKLSLLKSFTAIGFKNYVALKNYHELLLFLKAYPDNIEILNVVNEEQGRVIKEVLKIMKGDNAKAQQSLSGSGIAGTVLISQYSYSITNWLAQKFPQCVSFHSSSANVETGINILHYLFPEIEYYYTTQEKCAVQKRLIFLFSKNKGKLQNIVKQFREGVKEEKLSEILFDQLKIFTEWKLEDAVFNRSFIKGIVHPIFYHKRLQKKVDAEAVISTHIHKAVHLSLLQKEYLLDVAKASLAFYCRETEPVSLGVASQVKYFICDNGISIALYGLKPGRRLSIESYVGYMVFKNTVPVAYGGGWMFGHRCKIGLNIYPPFRSGESSLIFSEILNLYHRYYNQWYFIVKPYQYGKGNPEGLQTAAFWFYYKLGFRPVKKPIADIAQGEYEKRIKSTLTTLKLFTQSNIALELKPTISSGIDPEIISILITEMVNQNYGGDRGKAISNCWALFKKTCLIKKEQVKKYLKQLQQFSLMVSLIPNLDEWSTKEKKQLLKIGITKVEDEKKYIKAIQAHKKFLTAISQLMPR